MTSVNLIPDLGRTYRNKRLPPAPAAKSRSARVENVADVPHSLQNELSCFTRR
jgi:hypothetical protein